MKKIISAILVLTLALTLCGTLSACTTTTNQINEPLALSFVLGIRRNFPRIGSNAQSIYDSVLEACTNYGEVSYAVVEGTPEQTKTITLEKSDKNLSAAKIKEIAKRNANGIVSGFASLKAETPEVDTLQTVRLSANALKASAIGNKKLVVYDNGLCTAGLLSQLKYNVLATDPDIVVDKLEQLHALPDLEGVEVLWIGLGCVSGEQQTIPDSYKFKLETLWRAIIERSGGRVTFDSTPVTGEETEGLPHVSVVEFPSDDLGLGNTVSVTDTSVYKLDEGTCKFIGDKAELVDTTAAMKAVEPFVEYLKSNPGEKILIAGTTAKVGNGDGIELSYQRTQTVKKMLLDSGVKEEQIECIGLGCTNNCLRVEDHNADGTLNEKMAAQNRAIYIILADSSTARSLKST